MNTEPGNEFAAVDEQLSRLQPWQPRADFAARLAAAAARQAGTAATPPSSASWLWGRVVHHLPLAAGAGLLSLALAVLPWSQLAATAVLPWSLVGCGLAAGVAMTLRLLRSP